MTAHEVLDYTKKMTLLFIDDDEELRNSTKKMFENFFQSVDCASNGEEGLRMYREAKKRNDSYSLIVSDINMPHLDGLRMGDTILSENPAQPLVYLTAYNEMLYLSRAIEQGVAGFLTKPIQYEQMIRTFHRIGQAYSYHRFFEEKYESIKNLQMEVEAQRQDLIAKNKELDAALLLLARAEK